MRPRAHATEAPRLPDTNKYGTNFWVNGHHTVRHHATNLAEAAGLVQAIVHIKDQTVRRSLLARARDSSRWSRDRSRRGSTPA